MGNAAGELARFFGAVRWDGRRPHFVTREMRARETDPTSQRRVQQSRLRS